MVKPSTGKVLCIRFRKPLIFYIMLYNDHEANKCAVFVVLGHGLIGRKEILCLWISEREKRSNGYTSLMRSNQLRIMGTTKNDM